MTNGDEVRTLRDITGAGPARRAAPGDGGRPPRPRQREDAIRNHAQILAAAEQLFTERDPRSVTMDLIAKAAGVGRATLYRRFPDPASVAGALLEEHERILRGRLAFGPPPLGPGAPPAQRLAAFYTAALEYLERHLPLALGSGPGPARFAGGTYRHWREHVRALLVEAGAADPDVSVDALLSPLAPEVYQFQRHTLGFPPARIAETLGRLVRGVLPDPQMG
ncbi:TetR/AcrR family transcriptional regulator [Streptomyces sp. NBC_00091]|uniref:TetR/AcrR family transcriptional regulator n=1 Tax=Streptomyces sp. NBC_00091 TaxID=2975648 RepID=UPI00224EEBE9|nr:TetR/AcrR family transcriptional regulator [Streptomyces sp. NBC_00091]MCX5375300.1 TetR/AcrR family transcriptional regulator [Streptomyces sp. NBC_00091]